MANQDRPKGLEPKGEPMRVNRYTAGAQVRPGDLVTRKSDGKVDPYVAGSTDRPLGVVICTSADGEQCQVSDHPDQQYIVQADDNNVNAVTDLGLNYEIVDTASDASFNISRHELDGNSGNTTATLPLRLIDFDERADNSLSEANTDLIVKLNNPQDQNDAGI